jgi:ABC-type multidrug transport system fused ATPase/permease subunit
VGRLISPQLMRLFGYVKPYSFRLFLGVLLVAFVAAAEGLVALMIVLTFVSQFWVIATMDALRAQMGSVSAASAGNPLRASFDRLHTLSVRLESGVLLAGIAALVLISRKPAP